MEEEEKEEALTLGLMDTPGLMFDSIDPFMARVEGRMGTKEVTEEYSINLLLQI